MAQQIIYVRVRDGQAGVAACRAVEVWLTPAAKSEQAGRRIGWGDRSPAAPTAAAAAKMPL